MMSFLCLLCMAVIAVPGISGQSKTDWILRNVSLIANKLNERDKLWQDKFTELKQQVDSLPKKVSDIIRDWTMGQPVGCSCYRRMPHTNGREKFILLGKVLALCDTKTDGGGWVVIQRRLRGDVDFYRGWEEYKKGFGTPDTDFWIGNDIIHNLTSQGYNELRIDFVHNGTNYFAQYTNFNVADESSNYRIAISGYSGNVYNSMEFHNGRSFSTPDRDNDLTGNSCSVDFHGSWWYNDCYKVNLNGAWGKHDDTGIAWHFTSSHTDNRRPLTFTEMKIR